MEQRKKNDSGVERPKFDQVHRGGRLRQFKPKTRYSGHYFSRLLRNASQLEQTNPLSTVMREKVLETREQSACFTAGRLIVVY